MLVLIPTLLVLHNVSIVNILRDSLIILPDYHSADLEGKPLDVSVFQPSQMDRDWH